MSSGNFALPQMGTTRLADLPEDKARELRTTGEIIGAYLLGIGAIGGAAGRDPTFRERHLLPYLVQDLTEATVSIRMLMTEGVHRVAKRELRFILEASAKLAAVQQSDHDKDISLRVIQFDELLSSHKISIQKSVELEMLPEAVRRQFVDEVGKLYRGSSSYVHWTPAQIAERGEALASGRVAGQETAEEIIGLNKTLARTLAASLVLILHSVSPSVSGDILVEPDGSTWDWYFTRSKFIATIDSFFDYKHERQRDLIAIQGHRASRLAF
ncbi:MAG: hypothetical protein WBA73_14035 [Devosia sp.]